jgi:ectoine hydroxylase-related dioxygenase (phytanoyl-CoA dioxygenase family)
MFDEFVETGIYKIERAFSDDDAARMRDVVWNELSRRYEIERDDPQTWHRHAPTGLKSSKRSKAFAPICSPRVGEVLDALFGADGWVRPEKYGNVLVTMPTPGEWRVPHRIWHSDFQPTIPLDPLPVVKLWALFDDVDAGGAGTPQLVGSHRAFASYVARTGERDYKRAKIGFLASHPWLQALSRDDGDPRRNERFMCEGADVDGVRLRVMECTGKSGDVYVTHPWVFHTIATNATSRPRLMRSFAITRRFASQP